jgi:CheY-like chemotaxis protein
MSHELRTPLNSLLILAKLLTENKDKNLTGKQVEFAQTIYSSGTDLLNLINDILDLSKVEAGKMEVNPTDVTVRDVTDFVERTFRPVAEQKSLQFTLDVAPDAPSPIYTDGQRLQQVLKNLLSNAFKFTERGGVTMTIRRADKGRRFASRTLDRADDVIAFGVKDTGIGIARDKQQLIFEAFQQADGTTSRKYGGTGLGLSISREIARLLGGEIHVESTPAQGSMFTLFLPVRYLEQEHRPVEDELTAGIRTDRSRGQGQYAERSSTRAAQRERERESRQAPARLTSGPARQAEPRPTPVASSGATSPSNAASPTGSSNTNAAATPEPASDGWSLPDLSSIGAEPENTDAGGVETLAPPMEDLPRPRGFEDDRDDLQPGDRVVLIVEDDANFAHILLDLARDKGYKGVVAHDGDAGLQLAHAYRPDAITLDIDMPGIDGWAVLDRLKHHPDTRHIPVHIITGIRERQQAMKAGAIAYLEKPVTKEALDDSFNRISQFIEQQVKRLLVVEDDDTQRQSMIELIAHEDVEITAVATAEEALHELSQTHYDCMVLDLGLKGGQDGFQLLETVKSDPGMRDLPIIIYTGKELSQEEETRLKRFADTIIIKDVKSPERLLDETALFLHRVEAKLPEQKRRMLERLHNADAVFAGKHVLIVDDDVRNIFSLTSVLEDHGMRVSFAENGKQAIDLLKSTPGVDLVLMDVMMPEMDGYETTRAVRHIPELRNLPIIALTAKAMKGDREKCIAAGASDYITKPVDTEQLLSLMRVWLYR